MAEPVGRNGPNPAHPFTCATSKDYTFCAPKQNGGAFFLGVHAAGPFAPSHDVARIRGWLQHPSARPSRLPFVHAGLPPMVNARWYRVDRDLPPNVVKRNGTRDGVGPNCYATVLETAGYAHLGHRHVHTDEFRYYLMRDYEPVTCGDAPPMGTVVVYDRHPSTYDPGDHAAFALAGGLLFHKGGWSHDYPYEVVPLTGAMQAIDSHFIPRGDDRFRRGPPGGPSTGYKHRCYRRRPRPLTRQTRWTSQDRTWFLPLFRYYILRLRAAATIPWSEFRRQRPDLLTIENMRYIKHAFEQRLGNHNRPEVLLSLDDEVAQAFLEIESLSWQHQAMTDTYAPINPRRYREEIAALYREHYVTFDARFHEELAVHLKLRGVPSHQHRQATELIVQRIKQYDPVQFANSNGNRGIPYFQIVNEIAKRFTPRR